MRRAAEDVETVVFQVSANVGINLVFLCGKVFSRWLAEVVAGEDKGFVLIGYAAPIKLVGVYCRLGFCYRRTADAQKQNYASELHVAPVDKKLTPIPAMILAMRVYE
jgi:hypothetical protein